MALAFSLVVPTTLYTSTRLLSKISVKQVHSHTSRVSQEIQCNSLCLKTCDEKIVRRSANYQPPIWDYDYVQSLSSKYVGDKYARRAAKLKEDVKIMLDEEVDPVDGLEMIDDLQRLGVFYHFEDEIKRVLESIYNNKYDKWKEEDLHATALKFRLLRQHGYDVPQEVFKNFMDETRNFKACLSKDIRGMLYLYEASYLSIRGESILEEARDFATKNLKRNLKRKDLDPDLALLVSHALELPLHWRMPRLEARWFIELCERRPNINATMLQLAKLDYNMVQAIHQEDLRHVSRKKTGLGKELGFIRDRLMESFLWAIGMNFKPQFSNFRRNITVVIALITAIDDVYDVYGTLDELEIFTNAIERWDLNAMEQLPDYMKICFLALFNAINEMGYEILTAQDLYIIPHLQKSEAKWYYSGYTPTLEEYMDAAWISSAIPVLLTHAFFSWGNPLTTEGSECSNKCPNIFRWSGTIIRLADDLGTSPDEMLRGDNPKSIQCYMHETGASEKDAREHIKYLIEETWKKMNEDRFADSPFSQAFVEVALNVARVSQLMYQYGDGHAAQGCETKNRVLSLLVNPIPLEY
ncbi:hypothetical protein Vadar_033751 [Vaccinium darrowii]|uniref:Uncharacterized protein n=1 Tax=Vaccinium darrowii TaxID=229202 RepID=A0ACB7YRP3_9ERIC|nr:hypothetical protein Vadar_033751 [Vaccinium darrowii]